MGTRVRLLAALGLLAMAIAAGWYFQWRASNATMLADFAWFQQLGFPDLQDKPFVRVYTGDAGREDDDGNTLPDQLDAFLLSSSATNFTVFGTELKTSSFTPDPPNSTNQFPIHFEKLDLRAQARKTLKFITSPDDEIPPAELPAWGSGRTDTFILAWACWRNGLNPEARRLYALSKVLPLDNDPPGHRSWKERLDAAKQWVLNKWETRGQKAPTLRELVADDLGSIMLNRAWSYADGSVDRPQLLERLQAILRNFPATESATNAAGITNVLSRMIAQDSAHVSLNSAALEKLPVREQVEELIFQLRDDQYLNRGDVDEFEDDLEHTNSPGHQLVRLGYAAVPQLIEELDDTTMTRSLSDNRVDDGFTTVGNAVSFLIRESAGRSFGFQDLGTNGILESPSPRLLAARGWWTEFQTKGEKKMLEQAIFGPDEATASQSAELLVERFPDSSALVLLSKLADGTVDSDRRTWWLGLLAKTKAAAAMDFLRHEMTNGANLRQRVAAADILFKNDYTESVPAMIRELQLNCPTNGREGSGELLDFLSDSGSAEAVAILRTNYFRLSPDLRGELLDSLQRRLTETNQPNRRLPAKTLADIERTFIEALTDTSPRYSGWWTDEMSFIDYPLGDVAARYLAELWPDKYKFDEKAFPIERERQRYFILNRWRQEHELPPIPVPSRPAPVLKPEDANLVTSVKWATNSATPPADFVQLLEKWKGKPFNSRDLVKLLTDFAGKPRKGINGFMIRATKGEDLNGVSIIVCLTSGREPRRYEFINRDSRIIIGGHEMPSRNLWRNDYDLPIRWKDLTKAVNKATSAPPQIPYEIGVFLRTVYPMH